MNLTPALPQPQPSPHPGPQPRPLLRRLVAAVRRLREGDPYLLPLTVELEGPAGTWHEVLRGDLHESELALLLADQQRLFPGCALRVRDLRNGEVLARN